MSTAALHQEAVEIAIEGVGVAIKRSSMPMGFGELTRTQLIKGCTQTFAPGTLSAIMGGSGSGKSTLLNLMAGRLGEEGSWELSGTVAINKQPFDQFPRDLIAYVKQEDDLNPYLTVEETLGFAASLRLGGRYSKEQRDDLVNAVIMELGLKIARHTLVGAADGSPRGCSGGERRRVSIGVQLLTNPALLLLDEPTTGLDSSTALHLVQTLHDLSRRGRTVIMSVHQPRTAITDLFDNVVLMTRGRVAFSGPQLSMSQYFTDLGYPLPKFMNPADFFIDITSVDSRTKVLERETIGRVERIVDKWESDGAKLFPFEQRAAIEAPAEDDNKDNAAAEGGSAATSIPMQVLNSQSSAAVLATMEGPSRNKRGTAASGRASFFSQVAILTRRNYISSWRDWRGLLGDLVSHIFLGGMVGLINYQLTGSLTGIRGMEIVLFFGVTLKVYLCLLTYMQKFAAETVPQFDREIADGMYYPSAWVLAQVMTALPFVFHALVYSLFSFLLPGLDLSGGGWRFFIFWFVIALCNYTGWAIALFSVAFNREYARANLIANILFTFLSMAFGYLIPISDLPPWTQWLHWISFFNYGFRALMSAVFTGFVGDCPYPDPATNPSCAQYQGAFILSTYNVAENDYVVPFIGMVAWIVIALAGAALALTYIRIPVHAGKNPNGSKVGGADGVSADSDILLSNGENSLKDDELASISTAPAVSIVDLRLHTKPVPILSGAIKPRDILKGVNATFAPGMVSVILGGSGSGKSSILNAIAHRVPKGVFIPMVQTGKILFNNKKRSANKVKKLCAYVTQDDTALLPCLTVAETFYFMALLRMPATMTEQERKDEATAVINNLGLRECADIVVGSELVKGISGGQKRRVSIGIQLLSRPSVLLLDEPTSGLDAFNSQSVMLLLRALARDRVRPMTVICSIHQPRSDIWSIIDNICVLTHGEVVYAGSAPASLAYMSEHNLPCPPNVNPADHILDMSSIDLRSAEAEELTRNRVRDLVQAFKSSSKPSPETAIAAQNTDGAALPGTSEAAAAADQANEDDADDSVADLIAAAAGKPGQPGSIPLGEMTTDQIKQQEDELRRSSKVSSFRAFTVLTRRTWLNLSRQTEKLLIRPNQAMFVALVFALYWAPLGYDYDSIQSRIGIIYQFGTLQPIGLLNSVAIYPELRRVFDREYADGLYGPLPFTLSYMVSELPLQLIGVGLFCIVTYFIIGLRWNSYHFLVGLFAEFVVYNVGESQGLMIASLVDDIGVTVVLTSSIQAVQGALSGALSVDIPQWLQDLNYVSSIRYAVRLVLVDQFHDGLNLTCTPAQAYPDGTCFIPDGDAVLEDVLDLDYNDFNSYLIGLACCFVVYRLAYYVVLRIKVTYF